MTFTSNLLRDRKKIPIGVKETFRSYLLDEADFMLNLDNENHLKQHSNDLTEKLKELSCLYSISQITEDLSKSINEILQDIILIIPPAWQWPDITCVRINFREATYTTDNFQETPWKQTVDITTEGISEGEIEIFYLEKTSEFDVEPFLQEERHLLDEISRQISGFLIRKQISEELHKSEERIRSLVENSPDLIIIVDRKGIIQFINRSIDGSPIDKMLGISFYKTIQSKYRRKYRKVLDRVFKTGKATRIETMEDKVGGRTKWYENRIAPIKRDGKVINAMVITRDISDRIMEGKLRVSLEEKEVLLQEVHHRVKNNLQVISSLLNIQSKRLKDKQAFELFRKSQDRVKTMALIHEKLYRSEDIARINFADYVQDLIKQLFVSHGITRERISSRIDIKDIFLDITAAIPCGLIINELVSNSIKHAFPGDHKGEIYIKMHKRRKNKIILTFRDNGIGFSNDWNFSEIDTLGLQLVFTLVKQLDGTINLDSRNKAEFKIEFKINI